ncbi:sensor histidine kinase [Streptomyces longispororuber]|uniref:sensor histidine kinase n=1 Tax=Streptomyces longispororuber TaxID=68230 RepID=UPI002109512C|nr:histidine kinase [Streptomyces longispororuber]MCQ4213287.1 histidine kinase [Streptomyces longispororuber]
MARKRWRDRSKIERVEWQNRVMLRTICWFFLVSWSIWPLLGNIRHSGVAYGLSAALMVVQVLQCVVADRHISSGLDQYLGRGPVPRAQQAAALGLTAAALALIAALIGTQGVEHGLIALPLLFTPMPFGLSYALTVQSPRRFLLQWGAGTLVVLGVFALVGCDLVRLGVSAGILALTGPLCLLCSRCGAWNLAVMWESEHSREVEARLAVAEERLRFGRDLHDVMGRNLAVVALKSELATQLARRGRTDDAVAQMIEVQRIAQESQKEVRAVVRGYREADLGVELAGAQGVLSAAGIECTVTGSPAGLSGEVQSALGWVVREATTNVLRHGDARQCAVRLETGSEGVVLTVENDGVAADAGAGGGSGLAGLRERLREVGGELEAGVVRTGVFRVVASAPVRERESAR